MASAPLRFTLRQQLGLWLGTLLPKLLLSLPSLLSHQLMYLKN